MQKAEAVSPQDTKNKAKEQNKVSVLQEQYDAYKSHYARNIKFDSSAENLSMMVYFMGSINVIISGTSIEYSELQLYQVYFDTETFDVIERDIKITWTAQLGLIGGTMGLLTGFSILSAVEILYYVSKYFLSRRIWRQELRKI